jgi:hypothetical protein
VKQLAIALLVLGVLPAPAAPAQPAGTIPRVGILLPGPLAPRVHQWDTFRQVFRELGYTEGRKAGHQAV